MIFPFLRRIAYTSRKLAIIGNGFDLAHGLKTSYYDFVCAQKEGTTMTFLKGTVTVANIGILLRTESMKYLCSASNAYMMISMTIMRFYMIPTK